MLRSEETENSRKDSSPSVMKIVNKNPLNPVSMMFLNGRKYHFEGFQLEVKNLRMAMGMKRMRKMRKYMMISPELLRIEVVSSP